MAFSFYQLKTAQSLEQVEEELLKYLQDLGIKTTDWKEGSPELSMLKMEAASYWVLIQQGRENARNSINQFASSSALTYLADSHFDNQRVLAGQTEGLMVVTGSSEVVPRTFQASELKVTDGTYNFFNKEQFTISNAIPYVTTSFFAEEVGAEYNISANSDISIVGTDIGFIVSNPPYQYAAISGSWITTIGTDTESDETLRQRNAVKYAGFQTGDLTADRVKLMALSASSDIVYVSIDDTNPRGAFTVDVYCAASSSTLPGASIDAVQTKLNTSFFGNSSGTRVKAYAASTVTFDRDINIYYSKTVRATDVISSVEAAADAWIGTIPIGGQTYDPFGTNIAHLNDLITNLNEIDGVERVTIVSSSTDITLAVNEKLIAPTDWNSVITYNQLTLR